MELKRRRNRRNAALKLLAASPSGSLTRQSVLRDILESKDVGVRPNKAEMEKRESNGAVKWHQQLDHDMTDCQEIGWVTKGDGTWYISAAGKAAAKLGPDELQSRYNAERRKRDTNSAEPTLIGDSYLPKVVSAFLYMHLYHLFDGLPKNPGAEIEMAKAWKTLPLSNDVKYANWFVVDNYLKPLGLAKGTKSKNAALTESGKLFAALAFPTIGAAPVSDEDRLEYFRNYDKFDALALDALCLDLGMKSRAGNTAKARFRKVTDPKSAIKQYVLTRSGAGQNVEPLSAGGSASKQSDALGAVPKELTESLSHNPNLLLMGPPGTGKTYYTKLLRESGNYEATKTVQFHPAYAYEDFMEGLRPVLAKRGTADSAKSGAEEASETKVDSGNGGSVGFAVSNGVFKRFCLVAADAFAKWKAANPGAEDEAGAPKYLFIIDEINRGNVPKLMGELMLCLEKGKRGREKVTLPVSRDDFSVPPNVHVVGTMNTSDRSIAMLDVALRRRFGFYEVRPRHELPEVANGMVGKVNLGALMEELNKRIREKLGRHHELGHSYFMDLGAPKKLVDAKVDVTEAFRIRWYTQILPLLDEYFQGRPEDLFYVLGGRKFGKRTDKGEATECHFAKAEPYDKAKNRLGRLDVYSFTEPKDNEDTFAGQLKSLYDSLVEDEESKPIGTIDTKSQVDPSSTSQETQASA